VLGGITSDPTVLQSPLADGALRHDTAGTDCQSLFKRYRYNR